MNDIVENALYAEIDRLRARVKELEDCIDGQWGPALIREMKDENKTLKAELAEARRGRLSVKYLV